MTERHHYESCFSKETFEKARQFLNELNQLLRHFEGKF